MKRTHFFSIIIILAGFIFGIVFYSESVFDIYDLWFISNNPAYSHGPVLLLIALFFLYKNVHGLYPISLSLDARGLSAIIFLSVLWGAAYLAGIKVGHQVLFILILFCIFLALFGVAIGARLASPILLVLFAIPVWEIINQGHLQLITSILVQRLMEISGYLVYRNGYELHLTVGTFYVADNCSGMRQLLVAMPLALILSYMYELKLRASLVVFFLAFMFAFISNIIRIYIVVLSGQLTNMQHYFVAEDHVTLGWVIFSIIFIVFFYITKLYIVKHPKLTKDPSLGQGIKRKYWNDKYYFVAIALVLALLPGPVYVHTVVSNINTQSNRNLKIDIMPPWVIAEKEFNYKPIINNPDVQSSICYTDGVDIITLHINSFAYQRQGAEAIAMQNRVADGKTWLIEERYQQQAQVTEDIVMLTSNAYLLGNNAGMQKYVLHWYHLNDSNYASRAEAKIYGMLSALTGNTRVTVVTIDVDVNNDLDRAKLAAQRFLMSNYNKIISALKNLE